MSTGYCQLPSRQAGAGTANVGPPRTIDRTLTLMKTLEILFSVDEYNHGTAGSKPMSGLQLQREEVRTNRSTTGEGSCGMYCCTCSCRHSARSAMDRIRSVYGRSLSVTAIINVIKTREVQEAGIIRILLSEEVCLLEGPSMAVDEFVLW
jgi:hypothetical protein